MTTPPGQRSTSTILLESVQVSIESALAGLVLFALVYGAYRLMRRRVTWWGMLFTLVLLIILIGALPLPGAVGLVSVRDWLMSVPVSAGARGILLGIALATVVTGVRVLIGQDRSYREQTSASSRHFNGEWQSIQASADRGDDRSLIIRQHEVEPRSAGTLDKELDCLITGNCLGISRVALWDGEGRDFKDVLDR